MFRHDLMTFEEFTILSSLSKTNFCTQSFIDQNLCQGVLKVHFYQIKGFKNSLDCIFYFVWDQKGILLPGSISRN